MNEDIPTNKSEVTTVDWDTLCSHRCYENLPETIFKPALKLLVENKYLEIHWEGETQKKRLFNFLYYLDTLVMEYFSWVVENSPAKPEETIEVKQFAEMLRDLASKGNLFYEEKFLDPIPVDQLEGPIRPEKPNRDLQPPDTRYDPFKYVGEWIESSWDTEA